MEGGWEKKLRVVEVAVRAPVRGRLLPSPPALASGRGGTRVVCSRREAAVHRKRDAEQQHRRAAHEERGEPRFQEQSHQSTATVL